MSFTLEQFKQWVIETFPDNQSRLIAESDFRDGLANMADYVFSETGQAVSEINAATAGFEATKDEIFGTFLLADGLGTFSAVTGIAKIKETNQSLQLSTVPAQQRGQYFECIESGILNITGEAENFKVRDIVISRGTKWEKIPSGIAHDNISADAIMVEYTPVNVSVGYIIRATGLVGSAAPEYRRTDPIALSMFGDNPIVKLDIGNFGGSIAPVAYYSSAIISAETYLGSEVTTVGGVFPSTSQQLRGYQLSIPKGATHAVLSWRSEYYLKVKWADNTMISTALAKSVDALAKAGEAKADAAATTTKSSWILAQSIYGGYNNPFRDISTESDKMFRRSSKLTLSGDFLPLILICGQSNADGRAPQASIPAGIWDGDKKIPDFMMWNKTNNSFQSYQSGMNTGANNNADVRFGFDVFFAKAWLTANPGKKLYAIKQTVGGVPISEKGTNATNNNYRWQPKTELITAGQLSMCLDLVSKVNSAKAYALSNGLKLMPVAILYHQGEGDADRAAQGAVVDYPVNLSNLISWFRGLFQTPTLPFINGTIISSYNVNYPLINDVFLELNELDPHMETISMAGHETHVGDGLHYDATALQYLGQQMFNIFSDF